MNFRKKQILRRRFILKPESSFILYFTEDGSFVCIVKAKPQLPKIKLKEPLPIRNFTIEEPLSLELPTT
ncbi:Uncharacterised protein [Neisseria animaloris]|nr:Uncharacterised protein [Neisseria animaloris]